VLIHLSPVVNSIVSSLVLLGIAFAFLMLGSRWSRVHILGFGLDSVVIGVVALILGITEHATALVIIGGLTVLVRGVAVPIVIDQVARSSSAHEDPRISPGHAAAMLLAAAVSVLAYGVADELSLRSRDIDRLGVLGLGAMLSIVAISFLILILQRGAISKLLGILLIDNGILLGGLVLVPLLPALVEVVVLFDLIAVIGAVGFVVLRMRTDAGTVDTRELNRLIG